MSENKHTPEPWVIGRPPPNGEQTIGDKNGLMVAVATTGYGVNSEANARRIVDCVNACEGIPTDALERSKSLDEFMRSMKVIEQQRDSFKDAAEYNKRRAEDAEKQRDELLAALENCRLLAARHRKEEWAGHVLRFCGEAGVAGEVMR